MFRWFQVARRVSELEDQMVKLTRIVQARDLDWEDMRARCKRLLDRTEKAARRVVESETDAASETGAAANGSEGGSVQLLSPRQRALQQQILRRKAGLA